MNRLTSMLGVRFGLTLPNGKGILSHRTPPTSPEQPSESKDAGVWRGIASNPVATKTATCLPRPELSVPPVYEREKSALLFQIWKWVA